MATKNQVMVYVRRKEDTVQEMESLLKSGYNVNAEHFKDGNCTALLHATRNSPINFHLVELLLKNGANVEAKNRYDGSCTALLYAVKNSDLNYEVIDLLLQNGADVNATNVSDGLSVLMYAVKNPNIKYEIIELLLRYNADTLKKNSRDSQFTALYYAVRQPNPRCELIELLLEKGSDVNACSSKDHLTVFLYAIRMPIVNYQLIEILIRYGASLNSDGSIESPPLLYLIKKSNFNLELIDLLLRNGANVNYEHFPDGLKTSLLYAVKNPNCPYELIELLLNHNANVNSINYISNDSPLTYAVKYSNLKLVKLLLRNKAYVHQLTRDDYSAVVYAVRSSRIAKRVESNQIETVKSNKIKILKLLLKSANGEHARRRNRRNCESCLKAIKFIIVEQVQKNPNCISASYNCTSVLGKEYCQVLSLHFSIEVIEEYVRNCVREIEQMKMDGIFPLLFPSQSTISKLSFSQTQALIRRLISIWNGNSYPLYAEVFKSVCESKDLLDLLGRFHVHTRLSFETETITFLDWATTVVVVQYIALEDMLNLASAFFGLSEVPVDRDYFNLVPKRQRLH